MNPISLHPLGVVRSPFVESVGTPIQPRYAVGQTGKAEIFPAYADGLADLDGFDRIWILFWCHRSAPSRMRVVPYRDTVERGIFATRAPARPNPIGLSCVRLTGIEGCLLHLAEIDILDGSPILDIKPYVPSYDVYSSERTGWIGKHGLDVVTADARFQREL